MGCQVGAARLLRNMFFWGTLREHRPPGWTDKSLYTAKDGCRSSSRPTLSSSGQRTRIAQRCPCPYALP